LRQNQKHNSIIPALDHELLSVKIRIKTRLFISSNRPLQHACTDNLYHFMRNNGVFEDPSFNSRHKIASQPREGWSRVSLRMMDFCGKYTAWDRTLFRHDGNVKWIAGKNQVKL
jgi:hypothetical protein